jgi:hypothetical protein
MTGAKWLRHLFTRRKTTAGQPRTAAPVSRRPGPRASRPLRVEALEDRVVPTTIVVTSAADSGPGSLRAAINTANRTPGLVTIDFAIGAHGSARTIHLTSQLPVLTATAFINGASQGGSGYSGAPLIQLYGAGAGGQASGLVVTGRYCKIQGLAIDSFAQDGILLASTAVGNTVGGMAPGAGNVISGNGNDGIEVVNTGTTNNRIEGNHIGTNASGTVSVANRFDGILIRTGSSANTVGGSGHGAGNVISGNNNDGVEVVGAGTTNNRIEGNHIGSNTAGNVALPNRFDGVLVRTGAAGNTVGGSGAGAGNLIGGNGNDGVEVVGAGTTNNRIEGNTIGVQADGVSHLGNGSDGVAVRDQAANTTIGGTGTGAGNLIAFNHGNGVLVGTHMTNGVAAGTGNAIRGNSIFDNTRLGIFLGFDNLAGPPVVLANDSQGHAAVNNRYQNYPVLTTPEVTADSTVLAGTLSSPNNPGTTFRIDFYASNSADPRGFGQGKVFLGSVTVTTHADGHGSFRLTLPVRLISGQVISATATDALGNTSEFARNVRVP